MREKDLTLALDLDKAVRAYHNLGRQRGYLTAELLLMQFLPKARTGGRVCDITPRRLRSFRSAARLRLAAS